MSTSELLMEIVQASTRARPLPKSPIKVVTSALPVKRLLTLMLVPAGNACVSAMVHSSEPILTFNCLEFGAKKKLGMSLSTTPLAWNRTRLDFKELSAARPLTTTSNCISKVSVSRKGSIVSMLANCVPWTTLANTSAVSKKLLRAHARGPETTVPVDDSVVAEALCSWQVEESTL